MLPEMPEFLSDRPYTFDRVVRLILSLAIVALLVFALGYFSDVLLPFAVALVLAYLMNPLVGLVQRRIKHRGAAVALTVLMVALVLAGLGLVLVPMIGAEMSHTGDVLGQMVQNSPLADKIAGYLPPDLWQAIKDFIARPEVMSLLKSGQTAAAGQAVAGKIVPGVMGLLSGTANVLISVIGLTVIVLYLIFLLYDFPAIAARWRDYLPPSWREPLAGFLAEASLYLRRYFRAQALIAAITGAVFAIGFTLVGLPLAIILGLFLGLMTMVPYLQLLGLPPAVFLAFVHAVDTGQSAWLVFGLTALVFIVAQIIQDWVLTPRIMGDVTGLPPWVLILALSVWGKALGLLGLILAIPASCLMLAMYRRFLAGTAQPEPQTPPGPTDAPPSTSVEADRGLD